MLGVVAAMAAAAVALASSAHADHGEGNKALSPM
jgi:hypothetical protein